MKVLIVCSGTTGKIAPFIVEQAEALKGMGLEIDYCTIKERGIMGYMKHYFSLKRKIKSYKPDLIHAHYGLSGLLANLQRKIPVVTTFHGSDVNNSRNIKFSRLSNKMSAASIFVENTMLKKFKKHSTNFIIPCGVDTSIFRTLPKSETEEILKTFEGEKRILFSSAFSNRVKNYPLAKDACLLVEKRVKKRIDLIELKGYNRQEVNLLMNAVDCSLLTSYSEGSPQFIKEAMACNCPIVSTDVGDVNTLIHEINGCYISKSDPEELADKLILALEFSAEKIRTDARKRIFDLELDALQVANKVVDVYKTVVNK